VNADIATRVLTTITRAIRGHKLFAGTPEITPDTLLDDVTDDSLARIEIDCALEEEFGIQLDDGAAVDWQSCADVIATVERMMGEVVR
jgi:acyl carrier protein